jgi:hypothetical protein
MASALSIAQLILSALELVKLLRGGELAKAEQRAKAIGQSLALKRLGREAAK